MNGTWKPTAHRNPVMMMAWPRFTTIRPRMAMSAVEDDSLYGDANGSRLRDPLGFRTLLTGLLICAGSGIPFAALPRLGQILLHLFGRDIAIFVGIDGGPVLLLGYAHS